MKKIILLSALVLSTPFTLSIVHADDQEKMQTQDRIYGSQLMTQQERNAYRDRMRSAHTEQERERIRHEHHEQMMERAKERGVTIPAEPPATRGGMGPGMGMGGGMGSGGGGMGGR